MRPSAALYFCRSQRRRGGAGWHGQQAVERRPSASCLQATASQFWDARPPLAHRRQRQAFGTFVRPLPTGDGGKPLGHPSAPCPQATAAHFWASGVRLSLLGRICAATVDVCISSKCREALRHAGVLNALVVVMRAHPDCARLQAEASAADG